MLTPVPPVEMIVKLYQRYHSSSSQVQVVAVVPKILSESQA